MPAGQREESKMGFLGAVSIGVGGMVGGGIFAVLGLAVVLAGGGTPVAFAVAGAVALITAYSYAKLSVRYPSSGGTVIFVDTAFGVDLFTGTLNNLLWISYIVMLALYAFAFGSYGATFFPPAHEALVTHLLISAAIVLPALLNLLSADLISRAETYIVGIKVLILVFFVCVGAVGMDAGRLSPAHWEPALQLVAGGMIIFLAYEGFELIANTATEIRSPEKNLPRAFYAAVIFVIALYVLIAAVTVGALPIPKIVDAKEFALAAAARPSLGQFGFTLISVAAMLSTLSAINATLYGAARLSFIIAKEGELPALLEKKVWNRPIDGLFITAALALLLANLGDLSSISTMGSAGFLVIFAAVNAANGVKARETGGSRWLSGLGVLACLLALAALVWHTLRTSPGRVWILAGMVGIAFVVEGVYILFLKETGKKRRVVATDDGTSAGADSPPASPPESDEPKTPDTADADAGEAAVPACEIDIDAPIAINEAQLLLAEKRTSLAVMRTGIAVLALPMSVMGLLIATSKYYDVFAVLNLLIPLMIFNLGLMILGAYLIIRSLFRMRRYDDMIHEIKRKHTVIGEFID